MFIKFCRGKPSDKEHSVRFWDWSDPDQGVLGIKSELKELWMNVCYILRSRRSDNERRWWRFELCECFFVFFLVSIKFYLWRQTKLATRQFLSARYIFGWLIHWLIDWLIIGKMMTLYVNRCDIRPRVDGLSNGVPLRSRATQQQHDVDV